MACERHDVRAAIDALFVGSASKERWATVREHLYACAECRAYYDRVMALRQHLDGQTEPVGRAQLHAIGDWVIERSAAPAPGPLQAATRRWPRLVLWLGGAAAALGGLVVLLSQPPQAQNTAAPSSFQARSASTTATGVGLRAFCLHISTRETPQLRSVQGSGEPGSARCHLTDLLKLSYSNAAPGQQPYKHLFVFGKDEQQRFLWYYPHPGESSIPIAADAVNQTLDGAVRLNINHEAGAVQVYGLFTDQPLSHSQVRAWIQANGQTPEALPGRAEVVRLQLDIEAAP